MQLHTLRKGEALPGCRCTLAALLDVWLCLLVGQKRLVIQAGKVVFVSFILRLKQAGFCWSCALPASSQRPGRIMNNANLAALSLSSSAVEGGQAFDLSQALAAVCRATPAMDQGMAAGACRQLLTWMGPGAAAAAQRGAAQCQRQAPPAVQPQTPLKQLRLASTGQLWCGQGVGQPAPLAGMAVEVRCMPSKPSRRARPCAWCVCYDEGAAAREIDHD